MRQGAAAIAALVLGGCFSAYDQGTLLHDGAGRIDPHARQLGCLDVRVALVDDPAVPESWAVLGFDVGNGCDRAVAVDLRRVEVRGRWEHGRERRAALFDPRGEVMPATLDGRWRASEVLAFVPPDGEVGPPRRVCVQLARVAEGAQDAMVCLDRTEGS